MITLEFSVISYALEMLAPLIQEFEAQHRLQVRVTPMDWDTAWTNLLSMALQDTGPNISHVGTTWTAPLVMMNVLRPFTLRELAGIGKADEFVPAAWQSLWASGDARPWALPWATASYFIAYRRDVLEQLGETGGSAFASSDALNDTLERLRQAGWNSPFVFAPGFPPISVLHILSGWVWSAGGDFLSDDGKQVLFNRPRARVGLKTFFEMCRYLPKASPESGFALTQGEAAVSIMGPQAIRSLIFANQTNPELLEKLEFAPLPSTPWVGGDNLVIWKHTLLSPERERAAVDLASFLASRPLQAPFCQATDQLPTRLDVLPEMAYPSTSYAQAVERTLRTGRTFKPARLWGRVETRLAQVVSAILKDLQADPSTQVEPVLSKHLDLVEKQLNLMLS